MKSRKVILYIAASLDGFIAKKDGDLSFLSTVKKKGEDYGYDKFIKTVDTVIMGRRTYDKVLSLGIKFPHSDKPCFVISEKKTGKDENVEFFNGDIGKLIREIKKKKGKNIFIDGGSQIVFELMKRNLIDHYIISIIPVILGNGIPLFRENIPEQKLILKKSLRFSSGLVQLWYYRKPGKL